MFKVTNSTGSILKFNLGGSAYSLADSATKNFSETLRAEAASTLGSLSGVTISALGAEVTEYSIAADVTARKLLATGGTIQLNDEVKETDTGKVYRWVSGTGSADGDWSLVSDSTPVSTDVAYTAAVSGDWPSVNPTTVGAALDRIALRVKALEDA